MEGLWSYIKEMDDLEKLVFSFILAFVLCIMVFIFLVLFSRSKKLRRESYRKRKLASIEKTLFSVAFDGKTLEDSWNVKEFRGNWRRKAYKEEFLSELIRLHRLYDGEIAGSLRKYYSESGLMQLSFAKIRNGKWHIKCAGIKELAEMEITKAVPVILDHTSSGNETLRKVALTGVIHLLGFEGLSLLKDHEKPLNDWIQLNLLDSIKEVKGEVPDFGFLLESDNESIVVFALRLFSQFQQHQHLEAVKCLMESPSRNVSLQAFKTYKSLALGSDSR